MSYGIIYKATNSNNNKVYIGQTTYTLAHRKGAHAFRTKKGDRRSDFQIALLNEGFSNFAWEQIDQADSPEELDRKEKFWIEKLKSDDPLYGYNMNDGGTYHSVSDKTREKLRDARAKQVIPKESYIKRGLKMRGENNPRFGKKASPELRLKLSEAHKNSEKNREHLKLITRAYRGKEHPNYGKPRPEKVRKKISEKLKGRHPSEEALASMRKNHARGENNKAAKITCATAKEIKIMLRDGKRIYEIMECFGISRDIVKRIKSGQNWRHVAV
jgi:group I intron endonuclease